MEAMPSQLLRRNLTIGSVNIDVVSIALSEHAGIGGNGDSSFSLSISKISEGFADIMAGADWVRLSLKFGTTWSTV